jgi:hypothetical protein
MPLTGTITVTTSGNAVAFSTGSDNFRAHSLYVYGLTAGMSCLLDVTTTAGNSTGFTVAPQVEMQFPRLGGSPGFSVIASSAAGSFPLSYLASR